jgi:hypothetical protein
VHSKTIQPRENGEEGFQVSVIWCLFIFRQLAQRVYHEKENTLRD